MSHFGLETDPIESPQEFIESIKQLDPRYQGKRNLTRQDLEKDEKKWPQDTKDVITKTAEAMRMVRLGPEGNPQSIETPLVGNYDAVICLGAARQANLDRTRYAVQCLRDPSLAPRYRHLIVAGSDRKLIDSEKENTFNYAPNAENEFDLCVGAAQVVASENPGMIIGLSYTDNEKAGTPDVIRDVLTALQEADVVEYGDASVAAITTQIYQVSTELDLKRVAKEFGVTNVYVAGNPSDPELVATRTTATYLSEIVRTLKAAAMAVEAEVS